MTANQETDNNAWHWDNFFNDPLNDKNAVWGCGEIIETTSLARIAKMEKGDVVVAYQVGEGFPRPGVFVAWGLLLSQEAREKEFFQVAMGSHRSITQYHPHGQNPFAA